MIEILSNILSFIISKSWDIFNQPETVVNVETYLEKPVLQPALSDVLTKFDSIR